MTSLVLLAAPPGIPGPDSFIGRNVAAFFEPPGEFFQGQVASFERPHVDDSIDAAAEGIWYKVEFEDGHVQDYNITELNNILIPPGNEYENLGRFEWNKAKTSFNCIGTALRSGTANPICPWFLSKVFKFREPGTVSAINIKKKFMASSKFLHSDKTSRQPTNVRFVATKLLEAQRYYYESYLHVNGGGQAPTVDAPIEADFPTYGSAEFAERVSLDPEILTQDPMIAPNNGGGGANGGAGGGAGAGGGVNGVPDDLDGNDTPAGLSSFNDPNFDPSTIADDKTALASFNFNDTFLCPFTTVLHVPSGAAEDWARAFGRVTKNLIDACDLP